MLYYAFLATPIIFTGGVAVSLVQIFMEKMEDHSNIISDGIDDMYKIISRLATVVIIWVIFFIAKYIFSDFGTLQSNLVSTPS